MLCLNNLSKGFSGRFVLKDLTYNFPNTGIIALVGTNGAGKTTLLNILCGLDEPDTGGVTKPKAKSLGYLPQEPNQTPEETILKECMAGHIELFKIRGEFIAASEAMNEEYTDEKYEKFERLEELYRHEGGYAFEADAAKILDGLGFKQEQLEQSPKSLSGGWRMRLELARILIREPDFLILDEPTNHLDLVSIMWLETYLKKFKGTVLFVSHDESLLNRLPDRILHLKDAVVTEYVGNYDDFLEQYELRQSGKMAELKKLQDKISTASRFVERFKAKATKAAQARSRMKLIAKMEEQASQITIDKQDAEIAFKIPLTEKSGKDVLILTEGVIGYNRPLVRKLNLSIQRGQKIAIVGANGLGKSTLMKSIYGLIPFLSGEMKLGHNVKMAYYAQDQLEYLDSTKNPLENLKNANVKVTDQIARNLLGSFLFRGDDVYKKVDVLSGGEKSRLSMACLLVQDANFLLLDEPTNHLDILSTEILSDALSHYQGTVMFVSHNRTFIDSFATHILVVSSRGLAYLSKGNLEEINPEWLE